MRRTPGWVFLLQVLRTTSQQFSLTVSGRAGGTGGSTCTTSGSNADHLSEPVDVASGPGGDIYVLDKACSRVTLATVTGGTSDGGLVVAGGSQGSFLSNLFFPEALAFDDASGQLYIADTQNHRVLRWIPSGASGTAVVDGGPGTDAGKLNFPSGVTLTSSGLHVAENGNQRAQSFDLATCCATATQAVGAIVLGCEPQELACFLGSYAVNRLRAPMRIDAMNDELFIADTDNHRVLRVSTSPSNSSVEVVAGTTGIAGCRPEQLRSPQGVATDSSGFLYVADTGNHRIQKFAVAAGDRIGLTVAGECCCPSVDGGGIPLGGPGLHELDGPRGLVIDVATGALVVADTGNRRVLAFGGVGHEQRRAPGASCAYGVSCSVRLFGAVALSAQQSQVVIVKRDAASPSSSPCGSINCSFAHWPGVTNPQLVGGPRRASKVGGQFFDTYDLGMPHGPPNSSVSGLGEYAICWSEAPSTACVGYPCSEDNSCSNGTAWLCNGAQPLGLVRKVWHNLPGKTLADLLAAAAFPDSPDLEESANALTSTANYGDNYGQMFYGLFVAPETGSYVFEITSDENSELRISDAFNDTQGQVVSYISEAQTWYQGPFLRRGYAPGPDAWDSFPTQSGSYYMEAGHLYYLEVLHKERAQSDHLIAGASFFDAVVCTQGFPVGLAVVHDCSGRKTGQSCTAQCRGGWSGAQQTFVCDGVGILHGRDPVCTAVQCEEYNVEVGSLFMHGVWDEVDCSNMEGIKCDDQLRSWSGAENCASRVVTAGNSCRDYCLARGRGCVKSSADLAACRAEFPGQVCPVPNDGTCDAPLAEQICVCGRVESHSGTDTCLLSAWCSQGLMTPAGYPLGVHADSNDDLIVADSLRAAVVRWTGYRYEVIAGGNGVGSSANQLSSPLGVFFQSGNPDMLYVADTANHRIVAWPRGSVTGNVVFGTGTLGDGLSELRYPAGIYLNNSFLYVVDYGNSRVLQVASGTSTGQRVPEDEVLQLPILPTTAADSFFDSFGNFYRVDYGNHRLMFCQRQIMCAFTACKDVDPAAAYGPRCGCVEDRADCREASGALE